MSSQLVSLAERPTLKLVSADGHSSDATGELHVGMTWPAFFEQYVRPIHLPERSPRTVREYRTTLAYWVQFTGNPSLLATDARVVARFREGLKTVEDAGQPLSDNTRRKHCVNMQFIIDRAGPCLRREVETASLLAAVPYVARPAMVLNEVADNWSLAEIGWFLDACAHARRPAELPIGAATFWRCLGLFAYNVGTRPQTLLQLRHSWLSEDEHGCWLSVPASAMKKRRGVVLYVNAVAVRMIERMRACGCDVIFPWPHEEGWLHAERRRILAHSQISERRRLGFKALRKACATQLAEINPMAAQLQLGHRGQNVTRDFYVNRKIVAKACEALPQPKYCEDFGARQLNLF